jgi:cardiolipin synthase (CMP-forming)
MNFTVPNLLSLFRMGLIPLFVISVLDGRPQRALLIFTVAGITDALDGLIARFFDQRSVLGSYLDPAADKLLLTTAYIMLCIPGLYPGTPIPIWVTVLVIFRDVAMVVVALVAYITLGIGTFPPSWLGKINTSAQIGAVVIVLLSGWRPGFHHAAVVAVHVVAVLTVASGFDYVRRLNLRLAETRGR